MGGGVTTFQPAGARDVRVAEGGRHGAATGWQTTVNNRTGFNITAHVWVICASVS